MLRTGFFPQRFAFPKSSEASCQQQSTGSEEFYDQQEIVVRIHGRVTFSWYVFHTSLIFRFPDRICNKCAGPASRT